MNLHHVESQGEQLDHEISHNYRPTTSNPSMKSYDDHGRRYFDSHVPAKYR